MLDDKVKKRHLRARIVQLEADLEKAKAETHSNAVRALAFMTALNDVERALRDARLKAIRSQERP